MNVLEWGKRKWQEWYSWTQTRQEPDKENRTDYPSTRIEQEGAGGFAIDGGDKSLVTPADKQAMGNEIREAQGHRAQEQWAQEQWQEPSKPIPRSPSARELLADIRRVQGITDQSRAERDRAKAPEFEQGGIER